MRSDKGEAIGRWHVKVGREAMPFAADAERAVIGRGGESGGQWERRVEGEGRAIVDMEGNYAGNGKGGEESHEKGHEKAAD